MPGKIDTVKSVTSRSRFSGVTDKSHMFLTTGQVASLAQVATRTVSKWFDSGILKGWKVPGSNDRRFLVQDVARFFYERGIPNFVLSPFMGWRVLIACCPTWAASAIKGKAEGISNIEVIDCSTSPVKAGGYLTESTFPDHLVVGTTHGRADAELVLSAFAEVRPPWGKTFVVTSHDEVAWGANLDGIVKLYIDGASHSSELAFDALDFDMSAPGASQEMVRMFKEKATNNYQTYKKRKLMVKEKVIELEEKLKQLERKLEAN